MHWVIVGDLLQKIEQPSIHGCEVGVETGRTSAYLLRRYENLYLHMVDPYRRSPPYMATGDPTAAKTQEEFNSQFLEAVIAVEFAGQRKYFHRIPSSEAVKEFTKDELDFVFIDANHGYEHVLKDCLGWWEVVRRGGLLIGHDYGNDGSWTRGVKPAWDEFAKQAGVKLKSAERYVVWTQKP